MTSIVYHFDAFLDRVSTRELGRVSEPGLDEGNRKADITSNDRSIIERVHVGDDSGFDQMFESYATRMAIYAYGFVRSRHLAEEIVQDVFLQILERRTTWTVRESISAYLYAAVRGRALTLLRGSRRSDQKLMGLMDATSPEQPDHIIERNEETEQLRQAMAELPDRVREAMALRWHGQLSYNEIALVMGVSVRTVENQLAKGLRQLRIRLGEKPE